MAQGKPGSSVLVRGIETGSPQARRRPSRGSGERRLTHILVCPKPVPGGQPGVLPGYLALPHTGARRWGPVSLWASLTKHHRLMSSYTFISHIPQTANSKIKVPADAVSDKSVLVRRGPLFPAFPHGGRELALRGSYH